MPLWVLDEGSKESLSDGRLQVLFSDSCLFSVGLLFFINQLKRCIWFGCFFISLIVLVKPPVQIGGNSDIDIVTVHAFDCVNEIHDLKKLHETKKGFINITFTKP